MVNLATYVICEELDTPDNLEWKVNNWMQSASEDEKTTWDMLVNNYAKCNIDDFKDALDKYKVDPKSIVDVCVDNVDGSQSEILDYVYIMKKICDTISDMKKNDVK